MYISIVTVSWRLYLTVSFSRNVYKYCDSFLETVLDCLFLGVYTSVGATRCPPSIPCKQADTSAA